MIFYGKIRYGRYMCVKEGYQGIRREPGENKVVVAPYEGETGYRCAGYEGGEGHER
jgi:hypothetical protein